MFMRGTLLSKTAKAMKAGIIEEPIWFKAVRSVPPEKIRLPRKPEKIRKNKHPVVQLAAAHKTRHPDAKYPSIRETGIRPAVFFACRQWDLMQKHGLDENAAHDVVEAELALEAKLVEKQFTNERLKAMMEGRTPPPREKNYFEKFHEAEMHHWIKGLKTIKKQYEQAGISCVTPFEVKHPYINKWKLTDPTMEENVKSENVSS